MNRNIYWVLLGSVFMAAIVGSAIQASPYSHLTTGVALLTGILTSIIGAFVVRKFQR